MFFVMQAGIICFLLSPAAMDVNGTTLPVDQVMTCWLVLVPCRSLSAFWRVALLPCCHATGLRARDHAHLMVCALQCRGTQQAPAV